MVMPARIADLSTTATALAGSLVRLVAVGETIAPGAIFSHRPLKQLALLATEAGGAECRCDGQSFSQRPGTLAFIASGCALDECSGADGWEVNYLILEGALADSMTQTIRDTGFSAFIYHPSRRTWRQAMREAVAAAHHRPDGWACRLLARIALFAELAATTPAPLGESGGLLELAHRLVDRAPDRSWSTADLAASLGVGVRTLTQRFSRLTGMPPARWVRRRRLGHARALIESGVPVGETANRLGFANPFHFSRAFKREFGTSPSAMQRSCQGTGGLHDLA
jgi:AraC-like DNA-binding protein